ncbi:hypothetical protein N0V82_004347 [Gnomoniopsis sp. IMI 355080]|nr:hypothetical protein N0V82_004347 [Gnomoniopsis sp. IMI 355080]
MPRIHSYMSLGTFLLGLVLASPHDSLHNPQQGRTISSILSKRGEPQTPETEYPDTEPHPNQLDQLETAIQDAFELCDYVLTSVGDGIDSDSPIFTKYFDEADRAGVKKVFQTISPSAGVGNDLLDNILLQKEDPDGRCDDRTLAASYLEGDDPFIVTCPSLFNKKAVTELKGTEAGDDTHYVLCDDLLSGGDFTGTGAVSYKMNSLGMTLLHEYTHYDAMLQDIFGGPIIDQEDANGEPIGYGPVQVRALDKALAPFNADSYAYYASEVLWTVLCQHDFADPTAGVDDEDPNCADSPCEA